MIEIVALTSFGIVFSIVTLIFLIFSCCICVCCGIPALQLIGSCLLGTALTNAFCSKRRNVAYINTNSQYEMISQQSTSRYSPIETETPIVAEAVWVAPLAAAKIVDSADENHNDSPYGPGYSLENGTGSVAVERANTTAPQFQDKWASVLFISNIIAILSIAIHTIMTNQDSLLTLLSSAPHSIDPVSQYYGCTLVGVIFSFFLIAASLGTFFLYAVIHFPEQIIESILISSIFFWGASGCVSFFLSGNIIILICFGLMALFSAWYYYSVRNRIPFASAVLSTASRAIKEHYLGLFLASYGLLALQVLWCAVWGVAAVGVYKYYLTQQPSSASGSHTDTVDTSNRVPSLVVFLLLLSLYWGSQLLKSVMECTVSGTVGSWWFQPKCTTAVRGSLLRSLTTSFGSLCFGALLVAIIRTIREMLSMMKNNRRRNNENRNNFLVDCARCVVENMLKWMESLLVYFNKYSFCYVAAYGLPFIESGRRVTDLFYKRGWTAIINDSLVTNALSIGVVAMTAGMACIGYAIGFFMSDPVPGVALTAIAGVYATIGAVMGASVGMTLFGALESGVAMVFVCLADDAASLLKNHPREYSSLSQAWAIFNSGIVDWRVDAPTTASVQYVAPASVLTAPYANNPNEVCSRDYALTGTGMVSADARRQHPYPEGVTPLYHGDVSLAPSAPHIAYMGPPQTNYGYVGK